MARPPSAHELCFLSEERAQEALCVGSSFNVVPFGNSFGGRARKWASELIQANGGANAGLDPLILSSGLLYLEDGDFTGEAFVSVILDHYPVVNVAIGKVQYVVGVS